MERGFVFGVDGWVLKACFDYEGETSERDMVGKTCLYRKGGRPGVQRHLASRVKHAVCVCKSYLRQFQRQSRRGGQLVTRMSTRRVVRKNDACLRP